MPADVNQLIAMMPFAAQLGMIVDEASAQKVVATLPWAPTLCTMNGIIHGGVLMSFADTAGALVVFLSLSDDEVTATITSTTQMFRPVRTGDLRAEAVPLHRGRTTATAQTSLFDSEGNMVSQTNQIQAIRRSAS
ncbi:MAG TPA: PaaI family thioesterase [Streptosporangiaceae bacterium]|nr:PaaI family thioesterase [Streptosporangiaceae bacterium]